MKNVFQFGVLLDSYPGSKKRSTLAVSVDLPFLLPIILPADISGVYAQFKMRTSSNSIFFMFLVAASLVMKLSSFALPNVRMGLNPNVLGRKPRYLSMTSDYVAKPDIDRLITQANTWCALNGLLYSAGVMEYTMAPVALVPNTFSKSSFEYAQSMQPILNELVDVISRDKDFLFTHLLPVAESDNFVKRLLGGR